MKTFYVSMFNVGAFTKDLIEHVIIIGLPRSALPDEHTVLNVGFLQSFSFSLTHTVCFYLEWDRVVLFSFRFLLLISFSMSVSLLHTQTNVTGFRWRSPSSLSFGQDTLDRFKLLQLQRCVSVQPSKPTQSKRVTMSTSSAPSKPVRDHTK